jgi:hypothetical protein
VLSDGRSLVLLDDRGWSLSGGPGVQLRISREEAEHTTRMMVGPDEPFDGRTQGQMAAGHWAHLAAVPGQRGGDTDAHELEQSCPTTWR